MTVRLVTDIQNRLFWPSKLARFPSAGFPVHDAAMHPEMGSDVSAEQRLQGSESCVAADRVVLIAAAFPGPADLGWMSGPSQRGVSRRFYSRPHRGMVAFA